MARTLSLVGVEAMGRHKRDRASVQARDGGIISMTTAAVVVLTKSPGHCYIAAAFAQKSVSRTQWRSVSVFSRSFLHSAIFITKEEL